MTDIEKAIKNKGRLEMLWYFLGMIGGMYINKDLSFWQLVGVGTGIAVSGIIIQHHLFGRCMLVPVKKDKDA